MSETSGVPVTPEAAPADYMLRWQRHEAAQRDAAAQNRRIVFATLALYGITQVKVSFNGEGDSGQIEDMIVTPEEQTNILQREITMKTTSWPDADVAQESGPLSDAIENVCYDALAQTHGGWENNDGAYGDIIFDVPERTVTLGFSERYTSSEYYEHSWTEEADHGA